MNAVVGGTLVDPEGHGTLAGTLLWEGEELLGITTDAAQAKQAAPLDAKGGLILPAFVCGHVELGLALFPGLPRASKSEADEARTRRFLDALDRDALAASVRLAAMEALLSGVTVVFDLWRGLLLDGALDVIAGAAQEVGLRVCTGADVDESRGAARAREAIKENGRFHATTLAGAWARGAMGFSDPARVDETLIEASSAARRGEMISHVIHGGTAPSRRRLAERGVLRPGSVVVVRDVLDDEERGLLRDLQTWSVTTPRADLADAKAAPPLRGIAARTCLGGWGASADVLAERDAARAARTASDPALDPAGAWSLLARGWGLAAETFDLPFGRFSAGAPADLVVLEPALQAPVSPVTVSEHLERAGARRVRHVLCAGEVVVRDSVPTRVDPARIREEARAALLRSWKAAGLRSPLPPA